MSEVLRVDNICHAYQSGDQPLVVLERLSFSLGQGTFGAIMGASGVGKSTLLHLLGGLLHPQAGRVLIHDIDLSTLTEGELARTRNLKIGFVFQFHHLLPEFTALENIFIPALIAGRSKSDATGRAQELLRRVGLEGRQHHYPAQLSGGEQQRVAIARALINTPALLLMDEPTGNLDHATGEKVFRLIEELHNDEGLSVLMVTHNPELAARADSQWVMVDRSIQPLQG